MHTVGVQGEVLHLGVVEAEGDEHGAPVPVGVAVPRAVPAVALLAAVLQHDVVSGALCVPQLAGGNGQHVLCPVPCQGLRQGRFPNGPGLHVCVGVAGGLLFLRFALLFLLVGVAVGCVLVLRQAADQHRLAGNLPLLKARVGVDMLLHLGDVTDQRAVFVEAFLRVLVDLLVFQGAHQLPLDDGGSRGVAGLVVLVLLQPADGVLLHGNGGQNQGVGGAEHNHRRHGADHLHPAFSALLSGQKLRRPGQKPMFHVSHLLFLWWNLSRIILSPPAGSGARCGRRSFPRSDPPQCSPRPCSGSPPTRCGGPPGRTPCPPAPGRAG